MKALLIVMAAAEISVGFGLIAAPSPVARLLLGSPLETAVAIAVARVAGFALLALGVTCWQARLDTLSVATRGFVRAMLVYNAGVFALLVYGALAGELASFALWPVAISHAGIAVWCLLSVAGTASRSAID
jgi:hypothetical protein